MTSINHLLLILVVKSFVWAIAKKGLFKPVNSETGPKDKWLRNFKKKAKTY